MARTEPLPLFWAGEGEVGKISMLQDSGRARGTPGGIRLLACVAPPPIEEFGECCTGMGKSAVPLGGGWC